MDPAYWAERWQTGQTGFHQGAPHRAIIEHHVRIAGAHRVYVPLCGKAVDLVWLRDHGHDVVGSEIVGLPIEQLFAEQRLTPSITHRGAFRAYETPGLTVLEGDALVLDVDTAGVVDAVFDRAALVALDPQTRPAYVESLRRVLRPGGQILLVTFAYDQTKLAGPPWSVDANTVGALFAQGFTIEPLDSRSEEPGPKFVAAGIVDVREHRFLLRHGG